ncbi:hypothetical protein HMPREF3213_02636 [Heyndrickxia coagulans]|uniref:Uncharacterized protein n=1 Tax=Heyndrickxia coagulans TaxID=1398 RepID=A0A133KIW2_HEYCO|nr:hypothetical protein HMPREF3213_02636 [Heyndrickxia coagulans]
MRFFAFFIPGYGVQQRPKITRFPGIRQWKKAQEACKSPANRLIIRYIQHETGA